MSRVYLALRRTASDSATPVQRAAAALTRWRLASDYCRGGIVVDNRLMHSTTSHGLCAVEPCDWDTGKWDLFPVDFVSAESVLALFEQHAGAPYDWLGLTPFALPGMRDGDITRLYCFEWCALCMGLRTDRLCTAEYLMQPILFHADLYSGAFA